MKEARRYLVSGRVQGVGFRFFAQHEAERLGVTGYVQNLPDGRVEVLASGSREQLAQFRSQLEKGPRFSSVSDVLEEAVQADALYDSGFHIAHGG
jgi:acylphosphatase